MEIGSLGSYSMEIFSCLHKTVSTSSMMSILLKAPFNTPHTRKGSFVVRPNIDGRTPFAEHRTPFFPQTVTSIES